MSQEIYKTVHKEAIEFLKGHAGKECVCDLLNEQPKSKLLPIVHDERPKILNAIYRNLIESVLIAKGMKEAVGDLTQLSEFLFNFDPIKVHERYEEDRDGFYRALGQRAPQPCEEDAEHTPMQFEIFCGAALSGAALLNGLGTVWAFENFISIFTYQEMSAAVLPLLLQNEVCGLTFASACHFLNKCGYREYVEIEAPMKGLLFDLGLSEGKGNYHTLKSLIVIARANRVTTETVNRILRMIGSGRIRDNGQRDRECLKSFLAHTKPILESLRSTPSA